MRLLRALAARTELRSPLPPPQTEGLQWPLRFTAQRLSPRRSGSACSRSRRSCRRSRRSRSEALGPRRTSSHTSR
ncbi:hypothetical protein ACFPRL_25850 [Pseudoclavibacter helvolus]